VDVIDKGGLTPDQANSRAAGVHAAHIRATLNTEPAGYDDVFLAAARNRNDVVRAKAERNVDVSGVNAPFSAEDVKISLERLDTASSATGCTVLSLVTVVNAPGESGDVIREWVLQHFNRELDLANPAVDVGTAKVTPIFKGAGSPRNPGDYRSIAVVPALIRLLQGMIERRLYGLIVRESKLLSPLQAGFTEGRSTNELILLYDMVTTHCQQRNQPLYTCFLDLRRAYPSVNHAILMDRLAEVGVSGQL
jgi:hypothetical protein